MKRTKYGILLKHRRKIKYALQITNKIFLENDIPYWLEGGTLIAAVRNPARYILPWDNDGDISFHAEDIKRVHDLKPEFEKYGLQLVGFLSYKVMWKSWHLVCVMPSHHMKGYCVKTRNVFALIYNFIVKRFPYVELIYTKPFLRFFSWIKTYSFIRGKSEWVSQCAWVEFLDDVFPIPLEVEKYLTFRFGNWRKTHKYLSDTKLGTTYHKKFEDLK